ncbi:MAG: copper resistance protein CopC, partial [Chloroflexota bacterium]|nr:copper resistance protein CopC [Chloroflexota bacterium]
MSRAWNLVLIIVLLAAIGFALHPGNAGAHAELIRSDPPTDGLSVTSPDQLTMTFTEEVVRNSPAPNITLLDETGTIVGADSLPIAESGDPRTVVAEIPDLNRGIYTVSWTVTSATDGHALSGAYAFRVGGGLPPGLANTSEATPAPWAVATRWLTFLGASVAAGLLLFGQALTIERANEPSWIRNRSRFVLAGSLMALIATLAEPVVQWLRYDNAASVSPGVTLESLPEGWWWRPALLIPLTLLTLSIAMPWRGRVPRLATWLGSGLALGSLLGLSLTSHAAGRETYRNVAVATDFVHQVSVALWT